MFIQISNSKKYVSIVCIITAFIFSSCTSSEIEMKSDMTFEELKGRVNSSSEKLLTLDAYGEISIDSPSLNNTGTITVSINKPDSIFTKLEGPFGIDVADLLITRSNFIYYNVMDNKVISGQSTPNNLRIIMKVNISFDEIINAFSGKFTFGEEKYENVEITKNEKSYIMSIRNGKEIKKYWIDNQSYFVTKVITSDENGKTKIDISYDNFYEKDGIYFPKKISISRPAEKENIWLTYNNEEFNNNKLTYRLKIPKSAKKIIWK
jgi:hypothetical protein